METLTALLRGINVSGQKKILMKDLKVMFENAGFKNVRTYIQSGNVVFESKSSKNLSEKIEQAIMTTFGFDVRVIIRTPAELEKIIKGNPFLKGKTPELERLYVSFLNEAPTAEAIKKIEGFRHEAEQFVVSGKEIYFYFGNGYGKTKLDNKLIEIKLKVVSTTRNWRTVNVLHTMVNSE